MAKDVKFNIKLTIDGKQHIVEASTNVKKFAEELAIAQTSSNKLRDQLIKFNGIATSFQNLSSGLQQLTGVAQVYIDANKVQVEAETKLETVMRQRMAATEEEIQSIKDLASAQQALGVIGDEVQLMGIQQVSTFLQEKSSLDVLIPAMNNLLAQQKGLNATGQDAVNIGNMVGKVMQGQIGALTRAGITFTKAQEEIIKFGTESERAATLAQVITDNVGEMNAALAKTDAGKAKQAANDLGDLQEVWGSFISKYEKDIVVFSQMTMAISSGMTVFQGLKGVIVSFGSVFGGWGNAAKKMVSGIKILSANLRVLTTVSTTAKVAIRGLMAATGVGLAITALSFALSIFNKEQEKAAESSESLSRIQANAGKQYDAQEARIKALTTSIHNENIATETRKKYINELKGIVPGYNAVISEEGRITKENTAAIDEYLVSLKRKIMLQAAEEELTELYKKQREELKRLRKEEEAAAEAKKKAPAESPYKIIRRRVVSISALNPALQAAASIQPDLEALKAQKAKNAEEAVNRTKRNLADLGDAITEVNKEIERSSQIVVKTTTTTEESYLKAQNCLQDYDRAIAYHKNMQLTASKEEYKNLQLTIDALQKRRDAFIGKQQNANTFRPDKIIKVDKEAEYSPAPISKLNTIGELEEAIRYYQDVQRKQTKEEIVNTQRTINLLEAKKAAMQQLLSLPAIETETDKLKALAPEKLQMELELIGIDGVRNKIKAIQSLLSIAPKEQREELENLITIWKGYEESAGSAYKQDAKAEDIFGSLSSGMSQLGRAVGEGAGAWLSWASNLLSAIGAAIPAIVALTTAKKAEASANAESAVTGAAASVASIPFVGAFMAVAAAASVIAALANIPKFAKGGIAYGPTLGLFGEYAGASNNPEVVAPLDKLRGMLADTGGGFSGEVEFKIQGRTLVGILSKENDHRKRS